MSNILRPKQLAKFLSLSIATIWRVAKEGDFPMKVQISARAVGWREEDIIAWLEKRTINQSGEKHDHKK